MLDVLLDVFVCSIDAIPECSSVRVPKIQTIFGVVGMLKLVAGIIGCYENFDSIDLFNS